MNRKSGTTIAYYYENYIIQTFKLVFIKALTAFSAFYKSDLIKIAVASYSRMNN